MPVDFGTGSVDKDVDYPLGTIEDVAEVPQRLLVLAIRLHEALVEQQARRNPN